MNLTILHDVLLLAAGVASGIVLALLFWLHKRISNPAGPAKPAPSLENMTEVPILFQTMREIVRQQKSMARDFNRTMDKKIEVVREAVRQVVAGHEQLVRMQNELRRQIEEARAAGVVQNPAQAQQPQPPVEEFPLLHAIAIPEEAEAQEEWQGYEEPAEPDEPPATDETEAPRDPELAREAFRALLNLDDTREPVIAMSAIDQPAGPTNGFKPANGNGAGSNNGAANGNGVANGNGAIRARVYKYHDAGMSVSDIAQELGVGKGEVRLMLSLRNK